MDVIDVNDRLGIKKYHVQVKNTPDRCKTNTKFIVLQDLYGLEIIRNVPFLTAQFPTSAGCN